MLAEKQVRSVAKRPLIVGYYGMQNVGDDAFCIVLDWALRSYWGSELPMFAAPPLVDLPTGQFRMKRSHFESSSPLGRAARLGHKMALLRDASMLLFGGGSVFRDMGPFSEKRLFSWWSQLSRQPIAAVGVSIGPFVSDSAKTRLAGVLQRAAYIAVRDSASVERLRDVDYRGKYVLAADLVGLLPEALGEDMPQRPPSADGQRRRLGVTLLGINDVLADDVRMKREQVLIDGIRNFVRSERVDVTILVFNTHPRRGDRGPSEKLASALHGVCDVRTVSAQDGVRAVWNEMKRCDAGVHMRLHGGVFAYLAGSPFALVPYHRKCNDFLHEIGQPSSRFLPAVPERAEDIQRVLVELFADGTPPALPRHEFADKARLNFTEAPWAVADA
jgi:polysaccharide pyruvyl transferase WcaK-like protein